MENSPYVISLMRKVRYVTKEKKICVTEDMEREETLEETLLSHVSGRLFVVQNGNDQDLQVKSQHLEDR